jgi:anti-sigma factor RsiW
MTSGPFTMDQAAAELGISRRALQDLVAAHPHYYCNGIRKLFEASDIAALRFVMRQQAAEKRAKEKKPCRSSSSRRVPAGPLIGGCAAGISASMWTEAQRLLAALKRPSSSANGNRKLRLVSSPGPASPRS